MASSTQQVESILKLNVDYDEGIKAVATYINELKKLKDEEKALKEMQKDATANQKEVAQAMAKNQAITTQLKGEMKALTTEIKKKLESDRAEVKQIDINNASYNKLSQTYTQMKKRINEMDAAQREANKDYIAQSKKVYERMKTLQAETGKMQLNVGNYQAAITQAITGNSRFAASIMNMAGGANSMGGALGIVNQNALALGQTMKILLANPVFLAIAGIAGAGMAFKWFKDYNEGIAVATRLTMQFTGLMEDEVGGIRDTIQATADAFGKDFKEVLQGADTLVAQYGMSWEHALDVLNKGFAAGADLNGDMLSNIKQYGPALRDAGLSAEELVAVIQQTRSGVFGKDGIELITKASRSITNMTSTTSKALRGIGIDAEDLKRRLTSGETSVIGAIQEISTKLKGVSANSQEAGAIISDVFGRQGVKAGREQIKAFADLETSLDALVKKEGEYGTLQMQIVETQELINKYTSALFKMKGWDEMKKAAELYWKRGLLDSLRILTAMVNTTIKLYNFSEKVFRGILMLVTTTFGSAWDGVRTFFSLVGQAVTSVGSQLKGFGDIIAGAFTFDIDQVKRGWNTLTSSIKGAWQSIVLDAKSFGARAGKRYADGFAAVMKTQGFKEITIDGVSGSSDRGTGATADDTSASPASSYGGSSSSSTKSGGASKANVQKAAKANAKALEERMKTELEIRQRMIQLRLALVRKGTRDELELQKQELKAQHEAAVEKLMQEKMDEESRQQILLLMQQEYYNKRVELENQYLATERQRMEQEIANGFTERIMAASDNELEQERIKLEQAKFLRDTARQQEGESIEAFNARRLQLEKDYQDQKEALTQKEIEVEQVKLEAISTVMGGIGEVFDALGEDNEEFAKLSKVLALAEIAINTGKAIAAGVAQAQSVPFPGNIAAIATTVATIMANIATAIATVKSAKFAKGGLIEGIGTGTSDSITAKVSNGESVMTANATAMFSPLLSALNQLGGGVPIVGGGMSTHMGEDMLARAIAQGYALAPAPVVSVKEITDVSNRVQVIERMAQS